MRTKVMVIMTTLIMLISSTQAESFAEKKRMCKKTYNEFMTTVVLFGVGKSAYLNKLPEIKYYCKGVLPNKYQSFVGAMNKAGKPSKTANKLKALVNNHNPACVKEWNKIDRIADNGFYYQKRKEHWKACSSFGLSRDMIKRQMKVHCGALETSRGLIIKINDRMARMGCK